ncbi:molybdenum cofactor biosynthesis protein A [Planctomycetes bacterium CA13]|uniref:Molybdenum cofactor biosynthesis protein A n=1 Tax=Novipirellula herctigrandis TaxID=2527986 RepID=A0A5C5Z0H9_9BACT|nr:molybdenum cofactor biosynthesis protein A [Planctomycetes bacterium CA13]
MQLSLLRQGSSLSQPARQREVLEGERSAALKTFGDSLLQHDRNAFVARGIEVMQINVGKVCNQTCTHCHVDAGPDRRESMSRETAEAIIDVLKKNDIPLLDITGGAPEMNPNFRFLVEQARLLGRRVIDRCNLTILMAKGFTDLPEFLAENEVEIVASLPCYLEENCDAQRGDGVFTRSIAALKRLNQLGFGKPNSSRLLTLVYNPVGASLPPSQDELEATYRTELKKRYGVEFSQLFTIANLPISRFLDELLRLGSYDTYMETLVEAFNPIAADHAMCHTMVSVDWQGRLFDCDFNQMLKLGVEPSAAQTIFDFDIEKLAQRSIATGRHCYGCTAGSGSSCQGAAVQSSS